MTEREMESYWKHLSYACMTEESDDPDCPDTIIQHKLNWRSQSNTRRKVVVPKVVSIY